MKNDQLLMAVQDLLAELRIDSIELGIMAKGYSPDYPGALDLPHGSHCKVQLSRVVAQKLIDAGANNVSKVEAKGPEMVQKYLCYHELHVEDRTFYVHQVVEATDKGAALAQLEDERGEHYHLQAKGCLGLLTERLVAACLMGRGNITKTNVA